MINFQINFIIKKYMKIIKKRINKKFKIKNLYFYK